MQNVKPANIEYIHQRLPARLIYALYKLAERYREHGVNLFIFGSFANNSAQQTSDLDLGVFWEKEPSDSIFTQLYQDVQNLPTVRKIDLVNMESTDEEFREHALKDAIFLKQIKKWDGKKHIT